MSVQLTREAMERVRQKEAERKAKRRLYRNLVLAFLAVALCLSLMVMG